MAANKNFKPQINQKDNAIGTTSFKDELNLKKGAKVMIIHNISVPDGLTNGQRGVHSGWVEVARIFKTWVTDGQMKVVRLLKLR